jgi:hypothetical protein
MKCRRLIKSAFLAAILPILSCSSTPTLRERFSFLDGDDKQKYLALYPDMTPAERSDFLTHPALTEHETETLKKYRSVQSSALLESLAVSADPKLKAILHYRDGRSVDVTSDTEWDVHPKLARVKGDHLEIFCAHSNFILTGNFLNEVQGSTEIEMRKPLRALSVSLDESTRSFQKTELLKLQAEVSCQDGTSSDVSCQARWFCDSKAVEISGCGDLRVVGNAPAEIRVSAEYGGQRASKQIYLKR